MRFWSCRGCVGDCGRGELITSRALKSRLRIPHNENLYRAKSYPSFGPPRVVDRNTFINGPRETGTEYNFQLAKDLFEEGVRRG